MTVKNSSVVTVSDERGVAPVIGTPITIAIVFILTGLVSSVVFADYVNYSQKGSPIAKLQIHFNDDGNSLEFEHNGGNQLFFDSSPLSVIMAINETSYTLNDSVLGILEAGEKGVFALNKSGLPAMRLGPGDKVSVKVVDHENGALIAKRELEVKGQMVIEPEWLS